MIISIIHFGDRLIASIRKGDLQSFVSGLPLAPNTVRVVMQHVSGVFNTALDDGLLGGRNPCDGVRLPRVDALPVYPMSIEQVDALLAAAAEPFKAAKVTLDVYGHLWPVEEDRVRDAIGRILRPDELRRTEG